MNHRSAQSHYQLNQLDMSTARQRLKSPRSLFATSTHPTMVTLVYGHEWMTHILFRSMSIAHPIPEIKAISDSVLGSPRSRSRSRVWSKARSYSWPSILLICFLSYHINHMNNSWDTAISKFDLETSKVKVMSEVKGQGHILYPVSNWCTPFSFHINWTNHSWDMAKIVFDLKKTHPKLKEKCQNNSLNRTSPKSNQVITMTRAIMLSSSDQMSGSHFIVQTSKYLLIDVTAVTSGPGHGKVIQYILPDLHILCP